MSSRSLRAIPAALLLVASAACGEPSPPPPESLAAELEALAGASGAEVGLYYRSLEADPDSVLLRPDLRMHAASTMKVPVMMRLVLDAQEGTRSLEDSLPVRTTFTSIVDGSSFDLPATSDSDSTFYGRVGGRATVLEAMDRMITWSSNLATNLLVELAQPDRINAMLRDLGADSMEVLRGVEDLKAFEAGLSNTTTARDLGVVMRAVAEDARFGSEARAVMLDILQRQHFRENIPAGVPESVPVANKTGWITGINHDAALVMPPEMPHYVLVILLRGHPAEDQGEAFAAELSRRVWAFHAAVHGGG